LLAVFASDAALAKLLIGLDDEPELESLPLLET
jgi:hypothetical protein